MFWFGYFGVAVSFRSIGRGREKLHKIHCWVSRLAESAGVCIGTEMYWDCSVMQWCYGETWGDPNYSVQHGHCSETSSAQCACFSLGINCSENMWKQGFNYSTRPAWRPCSSFSFFTTGTHNHTQSMNDAFRTWCRTVEFQVVYSSGSEWFAKSDNSHNRILQNSNGFMT